MSYSIDMDMGIVWTPSSSDYGDYSSSSNDYSSSTNSHPIVSGHVHVGGGHLDGPVNQAAEHVDMYAKDYFNPETNRHETRTSQETKLSSSQEVIPIVHIASELTSFAKSVVTFMYVPNSYLAKFIIGVKNVFTNNDNKTEETNNNIENNKSNTTENDFSKNTELPEIVYHLTQNSPRISMNENQFAIMHGRNLIENGNRSLFQLARNENTDPENGASWWQDLQENHAPLIDGVRDGLLSAGSALAGDMQGALEYGMSSAENLAEEVVPYLHDHWQHALRDPHQPLTDWDPNEHWSGCRDYFRHYPKNN